MGRQTTPPERISSGKKFYMTLTQCMVHCLRAAGHDVDWREVELGEELAGRYDGALIGLHKFGAMTCMTRKFSALWTACELPYLTYFEDWACREVIQHMVDEGYLWNASYMEDRQYDTWKKACDMPIIQRAAKEWAFWMEATIVPLLEWGDAEPLRRHSRWFEMRETEFLPWDPSPWFYRIGAPVPHEQKSFGWTLVSMYEQVKWLRKLKSRNMRWPVAGVWKEGSTGVNSQISDFIPEGQLVADYYDQVWGVLLPPYGNKCGVPGWWRSRFNLAPQCMSVLYGEPSDFVGLDDRAWSLGIEEIELLDWMELGNLAEAQARDLESRVLTKEQSCARLTSYLEGKLQPPVKEVQR